MFRHGVQDHPGIAGVDDGGPVPAEKQVHEIVAHDQCFDAHAVSIPGDCERLCCRPPFR